MPLFMDVHNRLEGATVEDVVAAHDQDLAVQERYKTRYLTYWFNPDAGKVFCLVDSPSRDAAMTVHREAHGLVPDEIIEVQPGMTDALMNIRQEQLPRGQTFPETGEPDPGFRTIMFTDLKQSNWGQQFTAFDAAHAYAIQFQVNQGLTFDLCIDDLVFVR